MINLNGNSGDITFCSGWFPQREKGIAPQTAMGKKRRFKGAC
jgi:hypothetical protein